MILSQFHPAVYLQNTYDIPLVMLSVLIAVFASFVALDLGRRVSEADSVLAQRWWLAGGALVLGAGIWSMHFVGMLAFELPIPVGYDLGFTLLSWLPAIAAAAVALHITGQPRLEPFQLVLGALTIGSGIALMHYLGLAAMRMSRPIMWEPWVMALSLAIGVSTSALALKISQRIRHCPPQLTFLWQFLAALAQGSAIAGLHYTAMAAAHFPIDSRCQSVGGLGGLGLGLWVGVATLGMLLFTLALSVFDRYRAHSIRLAHSLRAANHHLSSIAFRDPLTGLANRAELDRQLARIAEEAKAGDSVETALLFIDLDGFKEVNDLLGHDAGDETLRVLAQRLSRAVRDSDLVARFGGDEFVVLADTGDDPHTASVLAQRIIDEIGQPIVLWGQTREVSCSIGISLYPHDGEVEGLVANADVAMYAAKEAGKSTWRFYSPEMEAARSERDWLHRDLKTALQRGQLRLAYQLRQDGNERYTAIATPAWHHPRHGHVDPALFLPTAERIGQAVALRNWMIGEAARQAARWPEDDLEVQVVLRLPDYLLSDPDLPATVAGALQEYDLDPGRLCLEISERAFLQDPSAGLRQLALLARTGAVIGILDFGAAYASLAALRKFPGVHLRLDQEMVTEVETDPDSQALVHASVELAQALGLRVTSEGPLTEAQRRHLMVLGCEGLPGDLLTESIDGAEINRLLNALQSAPGHTPQLHSADAG